MFLCFVHKIKDLWIEKDRPWPNILLLIVLMILKASNLVEFKKLNSNLDSIQAFYGQAICIFYNLYK